MRVREAEVSLSWKSGTLHSGSEGLTIEFRGTASLSLGSLVEITVNDAPVYLEILSQKACDSCTLSYIAASKSSINHDRVDVRNLLSKKVKAVTDETIINNVRRAARYL